MSLNALVDDSKKIVPSYFNVHLKLIYKKPVLLTNITIMVKCEKLHVINVRQVVAKGPKKILK